MFQFAALWAGTGLFIDLLFLLVLYLVLTRRFGEAVRTGYQQVFYVAGNRYRVSRTCLAGVVFPPLMLLMLITLVAWVKVEHVSGRELERVK